MNRTDFGPLLIVISRDEVLRQDISGPLTTLNHLIANRENIRANMLNVDVSFSGYDNTREELFEIPEVRRYVHALDLEFPYWLYFLSRHFMGLQCLAYCYLDAYLMEEVRRKEHPKQLASLIQRRWGPALNQICSVAGHNESEADALLESALNYFTYGPSKIVAETADERESSEDEVGDEQDQDLEDEDNSEDEDVYDETTAEELFGLLIEDSSPFADLAGALRSRSSLTTPATPPPSSTRTAPSSTS